MLPTESDQLSSTFAALADPARRSIVARLARGTASAGQLSEPLNMSLPAVSKHLKVLERADLIYRTKRGRHHYFVVQPEPIRAAMSWLEYHRRFWDVSLDRLSEFLEQPNDDLSTVPSTHE